ncbi:Mu transposase C-terminal domain-containing protein [Paraburkholderia fungorum]|uniref:Mu transposase C-terminal domain-containing protein n=1 Tax=Paraburkholderia fungorum TaxID=134537 RepID=UPI00160D6333|nr:Mu transposase C-terminal domain-containing protein [Paraburkholderia fungorum]MBB5547587.1 hypothetical protein [Paraburkholderia fungorum]
MSDTLPVVNSVIEAMIDALPFEKLARVLWVDEHASSMTFITMAETPRRPWTVAIQDVRAWLQRGEIRCSQVRLPAYMLQVEEDIADAAKAIRDRSWLRIAGLVNAEVAGELFRERAMGSMVAAHAKVTGTQRKTLYRLLYRYWTYGQIRNALLPDYENVGAPGKTRTFACGKRPGRPPRRLASAGERVGKTLGEDDKSYIKIGYSLYRSNAVGTVTDAYHQTLRRFYVEEHVVPGVTTDDLTLKPLDQLPTLRQFSYWGKKAFDDLTILRSRAGERRWQKDHRGLTGRAADGVYGPCHRFEIDSTIADIYLVSRYNRNWVIGRPVVYVVVDVFSTMIAGIFIGLEGPSWNGARHALFNAFTDKAAFCRKYGVDAASSAWPSHHLPQELMADRAEMLGQAAEGIVSGLNIDIAIAPPFRPDWKSIVESRFRLLNRTSQIHWIPGAVRERIAERGQRDYRLDATLDLAEFTSIMIRSLLHYNHHSRRPERLTAEMIRDELEPSPINLWRWGMENGLATPNMQPDDLVYLHLLPRETASIQRGGICFKGMYYTCSHAMQQNWFAKSRKDGRRPVTVWYDPNSTAHIWLQDEQRTFVRCDLLASEERVSEHRLEEVVDMLAMIGTPTAGHTYAALNDKIHLDAHIEATVKRARHNKEEGRPIVRIPDSQQIGNIKANRAFEKRLEQQRSVIAAAPGAGDGERVDTPKPAPPGVAEAYAGERGGEVLSLLGRLRQKGSNT